MTSLLFHFSPSKAQHTYNLSYDTHSPSSAYDFIQPSIIPLYRVDNHALLMKIILTTVHTHIGVQIKLIPQNPRVLHFVKGKGGLWGEVLRSTYGREADWDVE